MHRRIALFAAALPLTIVACGDDKPSPATSPATIPVTTPATTPVTSPATSPATTPATVAATTPVATSATTAGDSSAVGISLDEYTIEVNGTIPVGEVTFNVVNDGNNRHEFAVFKGTSYDELPHLSNGAVDEKALGAANILGKTDILTSGQTATLTVDLPAGQYVLLCNVGGPRGHAARGQVLSVTVG